MLDPLTFVEVNLVATRTSDMRSVIAWAIIIATYILSFIKKAPFDCFISTIIFHYLESSKNLSDFGSWIQMNPHPQYNRYLDEKKFKKFYLDDMGNIAWGKNRDLYFDINELHDGGLAA